MIEDLDSYYQRIVNNERLNLPERSVSHQTL